MKAEYDTEAVFKRLREEIQQVNSVLTAVKDALHCDERTRKLSVLGGIAALRRQRDEAEEQVKALTRELEQLLRST